MELYLEMLHERDCVMQRLSIINTSINEVIQRKNKEIGTLILDEFRNIFPIEQVSCFEKIHNYTIGNYNENKKTLSYDLDITDYLLDKYKYEFKKLINRKNKHKISFVFEYNLFSRNFDITLMHHGLLYAGLIRDKNLRLATNSMLKICKDSFDSCNICITMIVEKIKLVKEILDDYQGYLATTTLCDKK
jgi:hypothetical protein